MDSGDVIRAKQQPTEELQRTEEYTKADNRLRPNLRPLGVYDPSRLSQQELTACHVLSTIVTGFEQIWDVGDCDDEEL